jgi:hypothetical protein
MRASIDFNVDRQVQLVVYKTRNAFRVSTSAQPVLQPMQLENLRRQRPIGCVDSLLVRLRLSKEPGALRNYTANRLNATGRRRLADYWPCRKR